jgi:type I restriction-modification system DNA methylase subunit
LLEAPAEIIELVDKFERNLEAYKNPNYKEEQLKQEFINPFFKALGWDVDNTAGAAPQYRDVIFEDSIKISGGTKAPDYCFTLAGRKIFFVEAKKPSVNIDKDIKPSYQLRRYAWSAKLPLSILTDFEELAVYESRSRPKKTDRASNGRIKYLTYKDYVGQWEYLYNTFSKDAVLKGSYDKYAETTKKKKGTTLVDDEFLSEIETWRELLAKDIALRNSDLTVDELNYSVQQIIDRIIFLRMAEDRGAEKYGQLQNLLYKQAIYQELCEIWKVADGKYNSGLFHFKDERTQKSPPDKLTPKLEIKDGIFKQIIKNLYYPDSPYEFSVLSPEILGNVYEQFLGKVIRLTKGHQAKIEEKPEVKKAGGVFYTPQYIVEYIVENTVGQLCKDKTPQKVSELRILDPACGSGSFLLGAYNYLLNWHLIYYSNLKDKNRLKDQIYKGKNNEWHLTIKEKKRILLNNIYGVDIDHQAVEVTKLSLLLKVLEGENRDVLEAQQKLYKERALPDLDVNIKCGNSLIGPEIYNDPDLSLTAKDIKRINAFDWDSEHVEIMSNGGFDAIIGNPPYIRIQAIKEWAPIEVEYYKKEYDSASMGNYDIYVVFVEKGLSILKNNGKLGFIMPQKFYKVKYGESLREIIAKEQNIEKIVNFTCNQVFKKAFVNTGIFVLSKSHSKQFKYVEIPKIKDNSPLANVIKESPESTIPNSVITKDRWIIKPLESLNFLSEVSKKGIPLSSCTSRIFQGIKTSADPIYVLDLLEETSSSYIAFSKKLNKNVELEKELCYKLFKGTEMRPFVPLPAIRIIIFPYKQEDTINLIDEKEIQKNFPKIYAYLRENKDYLRNRENGKNDNAEWYGYGRKQAITLMHHPKIINPDLAPKSSFLADFDGKYFFLGGAAGGYGIIPNSDINPFYLIGLLNSNLLNFFITSTGQQMESCYFSYEARFIRNTPIYIKSENPDDIRLHDNIINLVKQMLQLKNDIKTARTPQSKELIQRQIDATDKQINKLVYELYGLTDDEIKIVDGVE